MTTINQSIKLALGVGSIFLVCGYLWFGVEPDAKQLLWGEPDYFALGQYYFNHGDSADGKYDIEKARYYYEKAIAEDAQQHQLLWHQLGRIDFLEGKFDDALEKFNKQRELFGDSVPNVHYMLGLTYGYRARYEERDADWQKAEEHFQRYITFDPQSPWARVDLAWIYFAQGKFVQMKELLEVGLTHHPDNPWLLNMYGLALLNTAEKEKAHQYFSWAADEADKLTVGEWGKSYPGNDPAVWPRGLSEFKAIIKHNLDISAP